MNKVLVDSLMGYGRIFLIVGLFVLAISMIFFYRPSYVLTCEATLCYYNNNTGVITPSLFNFSDSSDFRVFHKGEVIKQTPEKLNKWGFWVGGSFTFLAILFMVVALLISFMGKNPHKKDNVKNDGRIE